MCNYNFKVFFPACTIHTARVYRMVYSTLVTCAGPKGYEDILSFLHWARTVGSFEQLLLLLVASKCRVEFNWNSGANLFQAETVFFVLCVSAEPATRNETRISVTECSSIRWAMISMHHFHSCCVVVFRFEQEQYKSTRISYRFIIVVIDYYYVSRAFCLKTNVLIVVEVDGFAPRIAVIFHEQQSADFAKKYGFRVFGLCNAFASNTDRAQQSRRSNVWIG